MNCIVFIRECLEMMREKNILLYYGKRYCFSYFIGISILFFVDFFSLWIPQLTGEITDALHLHQSMHQILYYIVQIFCIGLLLAIGRFLWRYFIFGSARAIEYQIRNDLFAHLETLPLSYYHQHKTGDLMAHFINDLSAVRTCLGPAVITSFDACIMTALVLYKMIHHVNAKLTFLAVIPLLFISVCSIIYGKASKILFIQKQNSFGRLSDFVQEHISGIRVLKAFVQERHAIQHFSHINKENQQKNLQIVKLQLFILPLLDLIIGFSSCITLLYGGYLAICGRISIGQLIAFHQYIGMLVWPMIAVGDSITYFSQGAASLKRIQQIFRKKPLPCLPKAKHVPLSGAIQFKNVSFTYPHATTPIFSSLSFSIHAGDLFGIVGKTGSGKSTLAYLLLGLYPVAPEHIFLDNIPIEQIALQTLRKQIAIVPQDSFLFSDTIQRNILLGLTDDPSDIVSQSNDAVVSAATNACIHSSILQFPDAYQTVIGEQGVTLSGGQKQRICLARALIRDAHILILDDALSAVDADTEKQILSHLRQLRKHKTTIVITHRISTIQNANQIIVLANGTVKEQGTHTELLQQQGLYHQLYQEQIQQRQKEVAFE